MEHPLEEARLGTLMGKGMAEYRNQPGGARLIFGTFKGGEGDGARLREMAEARRPVRFEGLARDHARRYRTVVEVFIVYFDGTSLVNFRAVGEPQEYSLVR